MPEETPTIVVKLEPSIEREAIATFLERVYRTGMTFPSAIEAIRSGEYLDILRSMETPAQRIGDIG